jgi:flagellar hook-associated protein 3 FlgL
MSVGSISSSTISSVLQNTVTRLQGQMTTASTESTTGLLADIGLNLGADSGQDVALHQQMADLTAISSSNAVVSAQLGSASDALTNLQSTASSVLADVVTGSASAPGSTGALAVQQNASAALTTFTTLANAQVGGVYVFGGINTGAAPMASYAGGAQQAAVDAAFQSTFGFPVTSASVNTITGAQMTGFLTNQFAALFTGAGWTGNMSSASSAPVTNRIDANQTVSTSLTANDPSFQKLAQGLSMLSEFGGLNLGASAYQALMTNAQSTMNGANNSLITANAAVGTMQSEVTQANSAITLQQNILTTQMDAKEGVSSYDVASQVTAISNQLQTAYSLTAQIHKLSLVNFL